MAKNTKGTKRKVHYGGSDIYAHVARENFKSALSEYERMGEFEYVFGERYYLHRLACILEAIHGIWGLEQTKKEFTEFSEEIEKILGKLDKKYLRSQRDQCRRRLIRYYKTNDEEVVDLYAVRGFKRLMPFDTWFSSYVKYAIDLLDTIIAS